MADGTLSGKVVEVETVIWESDAVTLSNQRTWWRKVAGGYRDRNMSFICVPLGHSTEWVSEEAHRETRGKKQQACADVVVTTVLLSGESAVVAVKRRFGESFESKWWMQGGSVPAYRSYLDFVTERATKECGVAPHIEGKIGVYRTCADDVIGDTVQTCYVGFVPFEDVNRARADKDHMALRFLTRQDLESLPEEERHWYPMRVFWLALKTMS